MMSIPPKDDFTDFEAHLKREGGKRRSFNVYDEYERRQKGSLSFANKASDLHAGALVIWHAYQSPVGLLQPDPEAKRLGLGKGFRMDAALPPVFALLAGLSVELQIKAIARLLDLANRTIHRIGDLSKHIGISLSADNAAFAAALTEYVYWASRYPTPSSEADFDKARRVFIDGGKISLTRYESLWTLFNSAYWRAKELIHEP
jgi:hypothetical protein